MLFATVEELELQGIFCKEASQIQFQNRLFTRVLDFSKKSQQAAINICQEHLKSGSICLLVESQFYMTLWIERKEINSQSEKESFVRDRDFVKPKITNYSQVETKFDASVQTDWKSRDSVENKFSTNPDQPFKEVLYPSPLKAKISSETSIQTNEIDDVDSSSSSESSLNHEALSKKRPQRKYRGIPY